MRNGPASCLFCSDEVSEASHIQSIPYAHYSHTSHPTTTTHTHCRDVASRFPSNPIAPPFSASAVLTMWQWHFIGTLDKHPELDAGFPSHFHLLLVPKESNNVVMSSNEPSDPLKEGWQSLPVATNWLKTFKKNKLKNQIAGTRLNNNTDHKQG